MRVFVKTFIFLIISLVLISMFLFARFTFVQPGTDFFCKTKIHYVEPNLNIEADELINGVPYYVEDGTFEKIQKKVKELGKTSVITIPNRRKGTDHVKYANKPNSPIHVLVLSDIKKDGYSIVTFTFIYVADKIFAHLEHYYKKGNFHCFLLDKNGTVLKSFPQKIKGIQ